MASRRHVNDKDDNESSPHSLPQTRKWLDRIHTEMNACSLEVLRNPHLPITSNYDNSDHLPQQHHHHHHPLIIGCYQLDESNDSTAGNRDGQLRLYMANTNVGEETDQHEISFYNSRTRSTSTSTNSDSKDRNNKNVPEHICPTEAGILDGKWLQKCPIDISSFASILNSECRLQEHDEAHNINQSMRRHLFASACASGTIWLHALDYDSNSLLYCMKPLISSMPSSSSSSEEEDASNRICLALDVDESNLNVDTGTGSIKIISSYSDGSLRIHTVHFPGSENDLESIQIKTELEWDAHSLFKGMAPAEVWTCCWGKATWDNNDNSTLVLSGGDDCILKGWDIRLPLIPTKPIFQIGENEHSAGVTTLSWHPTHEHTFASGSYDEGVRIWDVRTMSSSSLSSSKPRKLAKLDSCGGGVWRLKWHPHDVSKLLVGAMHGGCRVLHVSALQQRSLDCEENEEFIGMDSCSSGSSSTGGIDIVSSFTCHESMAYGADWLVGASPEKTRDDPSIAKGFNIVASCSFYDQKAFLWKSY